MGVSVEERKAHLLERIRDMRELADSVEAELHIAVALADDLGVARERLAERAYLNVAEIDSIVAGFVNDDLSEFADSEMNWVRYDNGAVYI